MTLNDLENTMVVQMRNHRAPYSLKHLESALDLVCIWDREKDACQEEEIVNDNDFVSEQDEYSSKEVKFY